MRAFLRGCFPLLLLGFSLSGFAQKAPPVEPQLVDRIVAIVNDEVVTLMELQSKVATVSMQLKKQGTPLPPPEVLTQQILERLVMDRLQLQFARDNGIRVDDAQLDQALQRIAASNRLSLDQLRTNLQQDGIKFPAFREEIREEMLIARVRDREVNNKITISEAEIDNYRSRTAQSGDQDVEVAHILLRIPEAASPEQLQRIKAKADDIMRKIRAGENFAQLAAAYSDAPDGLQGGNLGKRPIERLPTVFADVVSKLNAGDVSAPFRSPNGFHIVKLLNKSSGTAALPPVQQTHVRHIIIRANELVSETEARRKLADLRERIKHGAKFAELARLYSQDGAASKGGDLGWLYPGDTVPEFERAMDTLAIGAVSDVIKSPFGFHLIEVLERKVQDASSERQRGIVRQNLREARADEAYQDWLRQLRDQAHVQLRLEE